MNLNIVIHLKRSCGFRHQLANISLTLVVLIGKGQVVSPVCVLIVMFNDEDANYIHIINSSFLYIFRQM